MFSSVTRGNQGTQGHRGHVGDRGRQGPDRGHKGTLGDTEDTRDRVPWVPEVFLMCGGNFLCRPKPQEKPLALSGGVFMIPVDL